MKSTTFSASLSLLSLSLTPLVTAVCNSGEIGVGVTAEYQCGFDSCDQTAENPGIYSNNCNSIAFSNAGFNSDWCQGNYGSGTGVQCDGNGNPNFVWTTGGNFHNCYPINNGQCSTGPLLYVDIYFCCQRW